MRRVGWKPQRTSWRGTVCKWTTECPGETGSAAFAGRLGRRTVQSTKEVEPERGSYPAGFDMFGRWPTAMEKVLCKANGRVEV